MEGIDTLTELWQSTIGGWITRFVQTKRTSLLGYYNNVAHRANLSLISQTIVLLCALRVKTYLLSGRRQ